MTALKSKWIAVGCAALLVAIAGCSNDGVSEEVTEASPVEDAVVEEIEKPENVTVSPELTSNAWQYLYDNREELNVCDGTIEPEISQEASETYAIASDKALVQVLCFMAAYQGAYQYYVYAETDEGVEVTPLEFTTYLPGENGEYQAEMTRDLGGLPTYDPDSQVLTMFSKGRGLGDCGSWAQYQLQSEAFELREYRLKDDCDGNYVEPEEYPQIYPSP